MPDVLCMGELLMDFVALHQPNRALQDVSLFASAPGGAPANVAVGIQRLGRLTAGFCGKVGRDPFGRRLRGALEQEGVDTTALFLEDDADRDVRTTIVFGSVWETDGHKELCFYRGADRNLHPHEITESLFLEGVRCFHYGSILFIDEPGASAQHKALRMARQEKRGLLISYDPNYRPTLWPDTATAHRVMMDGFRYAHLAKVSLEEWNVVTGCCGDDLQAGIQAILEQGVELLIVSRGDKGALATNGDFVVESSALQDIRVVETTGAGDGFVAAMITRLLPEFERHGGSLKHVDSWIVKEALDFANTVGGLACTREGAIPALPTADEVSAFLSSSGS